MRIGFNLAVLLLTGATAWAQEPEVTPEVAAKHVKKNVVMVMSIHKVSGIKGRDVTYLSSQGSFNNPKNVAVALTSEDLKQLQGKGLSADSFMKQKIRVKGKLEFAPGGVLVINIESPDAITLLGAADDLVVPTGPPKQGEPPPSGPSESPWYFSVYLWIGLVAVGLLVGIVLFRRNAGTSEE